MYTYMNDTILRGVSAQSLDFWVILTKFSYLTTVVILAVSGEASNGHFVTNTYHPF